LKKGIRAIAFLICFLPAFFIFTGASSAPLSFEPFSAKLPDGTVINIFMSGDEFFNYLHDSDEFPLAAGADGYYYYLLQDEDNFILTSYRFGKTDPRNIPGMMKVVIPSYVSEKRAAFLRKTEEESQKNGIKVQTKSIGTLNNLVIYIKFLNESAFTVTRATYESRLNNLTASSMRYYYREVSFNKLDVVSYSYPGGATTDISYTDPNPRNYYRPYNSVSNPTGYNGDSEKTSREHTLLANAVNWAKSNYSLPAGVNFDSDQNGAVDNVCFIVKGTSDAWNDLLWPHKWSLYSQTVMLGSLRVYGYTFQLENVSVNTLSHEMFHVIGAPDLYHYDNTTVPVGPWDIMGSGSCHMSSWMKYRYGGWIPQITEIKGSGTYYLKPQDKGERNSYILRSPLNKDQLFVLEYRKKSGLYENNLPASGLIIHRIDNRYRGNANGPPDEDYVFRLNGTQTVGGTISSAALSDLYGRSSFSDFTNPFSFFQDGSATKINISNITSMGDSIAFTVEMDLPYDLVLTPVEDTKMTVSWSCMSLRNFIVAYSPVDEILTLSDGFDYMPGDKIGSSGTILYAGPEKSFLHEGLISDEKYYYTIWTKYREVPSRYTTPARGSNSTGIYSLTILPYEQDFDEVFTELPRGWKASSGSSGWQLNQSDTYSAPGSILLQPPTLVSAERLYTPGFLLYIYNTYMISFRYKNVNSGTAESLSLSGGPDRTDASQMLFNIFSSQTIDYKDYYIYKAVVKPPLSKTYYFGFKKAVGGNGVLIDDFRIENVPAKTGNHIKPEDFYPNPTTGLITVPATGKVKISVFSTDGTLVYETAIEAMQIIDLSFLGRGIFLIRFETDKKTTTGKIILL